MICPAKVTRKYDILVSDAVFMYYINWYVNDFNRQRLETRRASEDGGVV